MISRDDVAKLADLSLMEVSDDELDTLAGEFDAILEYVSDVKALADEKLQQEKAVLRNVMRDDTVTNEPRQYSDRILNEMPDRDGDYLRVKKIL